MGALSAVEIDGSHGEGGGQVLRTALSLSALTGTPITVRQIRAGRPRPGLAAQHLTAVQAIAAICGASVEGGALGSQQLSFAPGPVQPGEHVFDVARVKPSAGAVTLILQAVLPPLLFAGAPSRLVLRGGTHVPWSPPVDYIQQVFAPALACMGGQLDLACPRGGWYPAGGGEVLVEVQPLSGPLRPLRLEGPGALQDLTVTSTVSEGLPDHIAARQTRAALAALPSEVAHRARLETRRLPGGPGTALSLSGQFASGFAGASALGEHRKPAEEVGREAAAAWCAFVDSGATVDRHLADQMLLYAALAGGESRYDTETDTRHLHTNAWVIGHLLPARIEVGAGPGARVSVGGVGMTPR